jgi:hypothetical protein
MTTWNWCKSAKVVSFKITLDIVLIEPYFLQADPVMMMKKKDSVFTDSGQHLGGKLGGNHWKEINWSTGGSLMLL